MTSQTHHFLADVGTIRKVGYLLSQPRGIYFNNLATPVEQLGNTLLQPQPVGICQSGCGALDSWYERFDFAQSLLQLVAKSFALLLAHLLKFIKSQINRFI